MGWMYTFYPRAILEIPLKAWPLSSQAASPSCFLPGKLGHILHALHLLIPDRHPRISLVLAPPSHFLLFISHVLWPQAFSQFWIWFVNAALMDFLFSSNLYPTMVWPFFFFHYIYRAVPLWAWQHGYPPLEQISSLKNDIRVDHQALELLTITAHDD